ncbi:MAG: nuclear transport factor 2 family protein [Chitinophagaceae bacterium]|nr:nuclear transport factor 2 family protein [Chitinophagaceae bacterium]
MALNQISAERIGNHWIEVWNTQSVDQYLELYTSDVVLVSSKALRLFPDSKGRLSNKTVLKTYWELVRIKFPEFVFKVTRISHFENKVLVFYSTMDDSTKAIAILTVEENELISKVEVSYV